MAAVIYARISKDEAGELLGVERQEHLCRDFAKERGLHVGEVIVDNDLSAYSTKRQRPGFEHLMTLLSEGSVDAVIVYHVDRLYRRTTDLERLVSIIEDSRAHVHTVAAGDVDLTTASGRMVARMLGAAAQHESERMSERLKAKHDELARRGRPPGGRPPYGYRWDVGVDEDGTIRRNYTPDPAEVEALNYMASRVRDGASLLGIAHELDAKGVTTREGRPWHSATVRSSLLNPAVVGLRVHRREIAGPGDWQPIMDRAVWEAVRSTLRDPKRKRRRPEGPYLLSGLVVSPLGDRMNGSRDRYDRRTYATRSSEGKLKQSVTIDADALEGYVLEAVLLTLDDATFTPPQAPPSIDTGKLEAELADLAALRGSGVISLAEWLAAREPLQARLIAAEGTQAPSGRVQHLLARPGRVRAAWDQLDLPTRRGVLDAVVERIVVGRARRLRWSTIEERLDPDEGWGITWRT